MEENKGQDKIIETYAEDMARVIEDDQGGFIRKIIEEEERKTEEKKSLSPESKKNKFYLVASVVLFALAVFAFSYSALQKDNFAVPIEQQFAPLVFNDKTFFIETAELSKEKIIGSIMTEIRETKVKEDGLEGIYLTKNNRILGLRETLALFKSALKLPESHLVYDKFMMGLINKESKDFFILLKMRSVADIFDAMRAWESKIFFDLHDLFGAPLNSSTSYLLTRNFEDGIVENKNARILQDKEGNTVMMYAFADENSIVIAKTTEAVRELIARLTESKIKK